MAAVRKSAVSTNGSRFQPGSTSRNKKQRLTRLESSAQNLDTNNGSGSTRKHLTTSPGLSLPVTSERQNVTPQSVLPARKPSRRQEALDKRLKRKGFNLFVPLFTKNVSQPAESLPSQSTAKYRNSNSQSLNMPVVPTAKAMPLWLLRMYTLHRHSTFVTFLLVVAVLVVYGLTVYTQELWGQNYRRLQNLQRYERQMTTTNATLTNKMAEEAEKSQMGFVSPSPADTVFIPSASHEPDVVSPSAKPAAEIKSPASSRLGY